MGVAGVGKSTVGRALARELGYTFVDADAFHSAANVARMARGEPLSDEDRAPWLEALRVRLREGDRVVLACSALRRAYRDALGPATFVLLDAPDDTIAARIAAREGHFAGAALLPTQRAALEPPELVIDATQPVEAIVAEILSALTD